MADLQGLDSLRDIHLPESLGWWPLAPGWYVLISVLLFLALLLLGLGIRRHQRGRAKRQALLLLAEMERQYRQDKDAVSGSAQISQLLKQVALVYFPRKNVAGLHGDAWIDFLSSTSKNIDFSVLNDSLTSWPYQGKTKDIDLIPLFSSAKIWIKQRGAPCLN